MSVWLHKRKGRIAGEVVRSSGEWTTIRLAEDAWDTRTDQPTMCGCGCHCDCDGSDDHPHTCDLHR